MLAQAPVLARCAAGMRGAVGVAGCVAAALAPSSAGSSWVRWWGLAAAANGVWTAFFVRSALRRGLTRPLVAGEVALTALLCLAQPWVLPAGALPDGVSWIAVILTSSMVVVNFVAPPRLAVPICTGLLLLHLVGARRAGAADGGAGSATIHALQIVSLALLMALVRRAARLADDVLTSLGAERQVSAAAQARRREEAVRSDELHNTVLATLTVVATGGITTSTARLREQSAVAADVLAALRPGPADPGPADPGPAPDVRLDRRLGAVLAAAAVPVEAELAALAVPDEVAEALAGAVEESLVNVVQHARAGRARVRLRPADGPVPAGPAGVVVEVIDEGAGFDPAAVPPHRYGLQHAVRGAVQRVGGAAAVESAPGRGTRVVLRWPA